MRLAFVAAAFLTSVGVLAHTTPAGAASVVQNRDEKGRNPYQVHVTIPGNCEPYDCTIRFPQFKLDGRLVIEQVSCSIQTPPANPPTLVFLWGRATNLYLRTYLHLDYEAQFNGYNFYVINTPVLFYFLKGDTPSIDIYRGGGPSTAPQGDCAISGYHVLTP